MAKRGRPRKKQIEESMPMGKQDMTQMPMKPMMKPMMGKRHGKYEF